MHPRTQSSATDGLDDIALSRRSPSPAALTLPARDNSAVAPEPRAGGRPGPARVRCSGLSLAEISASREERKRERKRKKKKKEAGTWKNLTLTVPVCHRVGTTRARQKLALLQPLPAPSRSQEKCLRNYKYNTLKYQVAVAE